MKLHLLQRLYKGSGDGQSEAATWQWRNTWQNSRYHNLTTIRTVNLPHMRPGRYSYVDLFRLVFSATEVGGTAWHAAGVLIRHKTTKALSAELPCLGLALSDLDWSESETTSNRPRQVSGIKYQVVPFALHTHLYCCWFCGGGEVRHHNSAAFLLK